ncbi:MAG: hypothetical protein JWP11_2971 [Frankiales bacterium]|nr:hypothetical protein [Frankiales bacterium]
MIVLRVLLAMAGVLVVALTVSSALRTVVLPRGVPSRLAGTVFTVMREAYELRMRRASKYEDRDAIMSTYGPISLLVLLQVWLLLVWLGYAAVYVAIGLSVVDALRESGSSLLTLGFDRPPGTFETLVAFTEAAAGLVLLALLITYLPSLYAAFSRREAAVAKLAVRAGEPPSGVELLVRAWTLERGDLLNQVWSSWEDWFVDIEETHTSFPALSYFRSPQPDHSWVTSAGAVLDAAALYASSIEVPRDIDGELCMRGGYLALRRIAAFFRLPYDPNPAPTDAISISRAEYDEALERLAAAGVPLMADREQAWRDFAGWRVNYDAVLLGLATLTMAPYALWSSDRSAAFRRPAVLPGLRRRG